MCARWLKSVTPNISHISVTFTVYVPDAFIELVNIIKSCSIVEGSTTKIGRFIFFGNVHSKKSFVDFRIENISGLKNSSS